MTTTIIRDVQETVVIHNMFNDGESLIVTATGALINTSFGAVVGFASHQVVSVQGTIEGQVSAILMGGNQSNPIGSTVIVGAAGYVAGMGDAGVHFQPSRDSFVRNEGTIYGAVYGVWMQSSAGINRITNTGTIIGETDGIRADTGAQVLAINNDGVIHGTTHAIATYNGAAASILNTGEIIGDIYLDSGNDIYNGTNGRLTGVFYGFGGNDTALGGDDNDTLNGMTGNDTLRGNAGNDILDGASGIDRLDGGAGNDGYKLGSEASGVDALTDASGIDTVFSTITRSLAPWGFIENLTLEGTADINGTGNALANTLTGNGGKNILNGGAGADRLVGGAGDDTYQLAADTTDTIVDTAGTDTILSTVTRSLASYPAIENLTLQGTANINGTGNDLNNTITGNVGQNTLTGGNGSDTLNGGAGMDILNGGNGDDYFILGADNDTVIDTGTNVSGDSIFSSITRSLAGYATIEGLALQGTANINGTGNGLNNTLSGNPGNNVLKGGIGSDTLYGGFGTDSLFGEAGNDIFLYLAYSDSPANVTRDIIYDFNDTGANTDQINFAALPGVDNPGQITLAAMGANTLVTLVISGIAVTSILLAGTTIGNGMGQVDSGDFLI